MAKTTAADYPSRKPKKPVMRKLPKLPKATASPAVYARYQERARDIVAENNKRQSDYERGLRLYEEGRKFKENVRAKARQGLAGFAGTSTRKRR